MKNILTRKNIIIFLIILIIIIFVYYLVKKKVQKYIIEQIEICMNNNDIKEGRDIHFKSDKNKLLLELFSGGSLALGESYMKGQWTSPDLFNFFIKILKTNRFKKFENGKNIVKFFIKTNVRQSDGLEMVNKHYNLGNDFFASWLDTNMQYSCAYWNKPNMTIDEAQIEKMNLIGRKLKLKKGMLVLDIGCGWGGLANYLSEKFGVNVIGISLAIEQIKYAQERFGSNNPNVLYLYGDFADVRNMSSLLRNNNNILVNDKKLLNDLLSYLNSGRNSNDKIFDRIVSVGFYEHVGDDRYSELFKIMYDIMKDDGICLLHTIGQYNQNSKKISNEWMRKYIFTRGQLPTFCDISVNAEQNNFVIEDWHNFGIDYYKTLMSWYQNFENTFEQEKNIVFYRMWKFYLLGCAAAFYTRQLLLWQIIFTKKNQFIKYTGER